jgi:hypothetical protein
VSKKEIFEIITLGFILLGLIFSIPNTEWAENSNYYGFFSIACGALSSIFSLLIPATYTGKFTKSDWKKQKDGLFIKIPSKVHGMGKAPQIQTLLQNESGYEKVGLDENHDRFGNVIIVSQLAFEGMIVLK